MPKEHSPVTFHVNSQDSPWKRFNRNDLREDEVDERFHAIFGPGEGPSARAPSPTRSASPHRVALQPLNRPASTPLVSRKLPFQVQTPPKIARKAEPKPDVGMRVLGNEIAMLEGANAILRKVLKQKEQSLVAHEKLVEGFCQLYAKKRQ